MGAFADRAIVGARVRTLDPERPWASAVAMRDGLIVAVGDDAAVRAVCDAATELVDGSGMVVTPGLVDAHQHPFAGTEATLGVDLGGARDLGELRALLAAERARVGDGAWIRGHQLHREPFGDEQPAVAPLLAAIGDAPMVLLFSDGHTALASVPALAAAGIDAPRVFDDGSEVVGRDGVVTGLVRELAALGTVEAAIPKPPPHELRARYAETFRRMNAAGLTGVHAMLGQPALFDVCRAMEADDALTMRLVVPLWQEPGSGEEARRAQLPLRGARGRLWRGGVVKFFLDGVVESGTAWLREPDAAGGSTEPAWPLDEYRRSVALFAAAGFQCATHAIGDGAVEGALDAYRDAGAAPGVRHRIEHAKLVPDELLGRFAAEDVVASMQIPLLSFVRADGEDGFTRAIGRARVATSFRTADLRRSGAIVPLGSDWEVASFDPRVGMAWARLRHAPGAPDDAAIGREQALDGLAALEGYTVETARAVGEEAAAGRIAPGLRADLTAFADDPVTCDPNALPELPVTLTVVDGRIVHRA